MFSHRTRRKLADFWTRTQPWVWSTLGLAALAFLWYFLATTGPGRAIDEEQVAAEMAPDNEELARRQAEVAELEARYKALAASGVITDEIVAIATDAVEKQRAIARSPRWGDYIQQQTLERLVGELDSMQARRQIERIDILLRAGEEHQSAMRLKEADESYRTALQLQRAINTGAASSRYKNYVREAELERALTSLQVYPLNAEKEAALAKARAAMEAKRFPDAVAAYTVARDALSRINRDFGRTPYADIAELDRIETEIASLNAADLAAEVDQREKAGDAAEAASDPTTAAAAYADALERQQQINRVFAKSRFVSSARIDALETKLQTARSQPLAAELARMDSAIAADLRARRLVAVEQVLPVALRLTEDLATQYPRSRYVDGALRIKLSYLGLKAAQIRAIQDEVFNRALPMVGVNNRVMLGSETPQGLYQDVMNTNPSRNPGRGMPVDSVNWNDASDFCQRLGWILGLPVRLPTAAEHRMALGEDAGEIRSAAGNGKIGTVDGGRMNKNGYRDLLGNVAEWLDAAPDANQAQLVGGSVMDTPEAMSLSRIPLETRSKTDRARHIGFRFVVDLHPEK